MSHAVETMMSVREKPWHYEMTKDVTKIIQNAPNSYEALVAAGLNWEVEAKPVSVAGTADAIPNYVANVRNSDGKVLGIVTNRYKIVQNVEAFAFTDTLIGGDVRYETAGSLFGGRKVWMLARLGDRKIAGDETEQYLCFSNTHDGTGAVNVMVTPVRVVCNNTLNIAVSAAKRTWSVRHVGDINSKIAEAKRCLELADEYMDALDVRAVEMANITIDEDALMKALGKVFGKVDEDASDREKRNNQKKYDDFTVCYLAPDIAKFHGTAWGAVNAMADYIDHGEPGRQSANYAENNWARIMGGHAMLDDFAAALAGKH